MHGVGLLHRLDRARPCPLPLIDAAASARHDRLERLASALVVAAVAGGRLRAKTPALPAPNSGDAFVRRRQLAKLAYDVVAGGLHRGAGRRGTGRAAGHAAVRQGRDAHVEGELLIGDAERVGGDLGDAGPGALPPCRARRSPHLAGAVGLQLGLGLGLEDVGREGCAVPMPQPTSRPSSSRIMARLQRTARPNRSALRTLRVALRAAPSRRYGLSVIGSISA